jgi:hypothetical protein
MCAVCWGDGEAVAAREEADGWRELLDEAYAGALPRPRLALDDVDERVVS